MKKIFQNKKYSGRKVALFYIFSNFFIIWLLKDDS